MSRQEPKLLKAAMENEIKKKGAEERDNEKREAVKGLEMFWEGGCEYILGKMDIYSA